MATPYRNPEIMQAVIDATTQGKGFTLRELASTLNIHPTTVGQAVSVLREQPGLVSDILAGKLSIHRAHEIVRFGDREPCPVCKGKGHVFRRRS